MSTPDKYTIIRQAAEVFGSVAYTGTKGDITQAVRGTSVMVWATTDAIINVGAVATSTTGTPVPAFTVMWLPLPKAANPGNGDVVIASAVQISAGGTLFAQQFSD